MNPNARELTFPTGQPRKYYRVAWKCFDQQHFGLALGNFLLTAKLCPHEAAELIGPVNLCLERATLWLEQEGRHQEVLRIHESVLQTFPENGKALNGLGEYLFRHGHVLEAAGHFLRAALAEPGLVVARDNLDRANAQLVDRWHFTMLNDSVRNTSYRRAVRAAVSRLRDGDLVLDVGAGTGLLSMMAVEAGASSVYACESSELMSQVGATVLKDNNMADQVHLIAKPSLQLTVGADLPKKAALLLTETFDAGLLGEHVLSALQHAWEHLLLPPSDGGRVLPAAATVRACAVESDYLRVRLTGVSGGQRLRRRLEEPYWSERLDHMPGGYRRLSEDVTVYRVNFNDPADIALGLAGLQSRHVIACTAAGRLDALVTWFQLELGGGVVLSTAPGLPTCWEQAVYPVPADRGVVEGERLELELSCVGHLELRLRQIDGDPPPADADAAPASADQLAFVADARQVAALEGAARETVRRWSAAGAAACPRLLDLCPVPVLAQHVPADWHVTVPPAAAAAPPGSRWAALLEPVESWSALAAGEWDAVLSAPVLPSGRLDPAVIRTLRSVTLAEGGLLVPAALDLVAVAVSSELIRDMTSVRPENTLGFDCSAINTFKVCQLQEFPYGCRGLTSDLTAVTRISRLDLATGALTPGRFSLPVTADGAVHGLVFWFQPVDGSGDALQPPQHGLQMVAVPSVARHVRARDARDGHVTGSVHASDDGVYIAIDECLT
ncbi:protein arginine N-methyltransferase 9-like [Pollicipes pollicipes]|uniref:protein arginine N-methyltransferase 9-like n=1 Tax=Pollicipes pollicipes TaxID=41117 RepID=UPI001884A57A|nr:protein arginine N-methyltransferase 9-like [Pollicipes pollicipes]